MTEEAGGVFAHYLADLGRLLKEEALAVREERRKAVAEKDSGYLEGKLMAYNEVISLMQQQALAFGLSLNSVGLGDIDPDNELVL